MPESFAAILLAHSGEDSLMRQLRDLPLQMRLPARIVAAGPKGLPGADTARRFVEAAGMEFEWINVDWDDSAHAWNIALERVREPIAALIDSRVRLERGCFFHLIGALERFAGHGVAAAAAQFRDPQEAERREDPGFWERLFLLRPARPGALLSSGFGSRILPDEIVGFEPFDVSFFQEGGVAAFFCEALLCRPFPEGAASIGADPMRLLSAALGRRGRLFLVPRARCLPLANAAGQSASAQLSARRYDTPFEAAWTLRALHPWRFWGALPFGWACLGLALREAGRLARRPCLENARKAWSEWGQMLRAFGAVARLASPRRAALRALGNEGAESDLAGWRLSSMVGASLWDSNGRPAPDE
ncbi:MAG: hypothetical protein BWZ10_00872 [candidate division BRC1 bacterium ADurb.BinA364]|nr:MAG: hypothetical protein BWZ10_00872 [candidate division BRC1 bacterium ADurb.BinA364]